MSFDQFGIWRLPNRRELRSSIAVSVPVIGIAVSEGLLYFGHTRYSLWGHLATLLVTSLLPLRFENETATYQALLLVPLFRLVNLGMPVFFNLTIYWFPLIYGPLIPGLYFLNRSRRSIAQDDSSQLGLLVLLGLLLLSLLLIELGSPVDPSIAITVFWLLLVYTAFIVVIYLVRESEDPSRYSERFKSILPFVPLALVLALFLAEIEYRILDPVALIPQWNAVNLLVISIVMFGFVGFVEELLFRGVLQPTLESRLGVLPGLLLTSALFGAMHSGYGLPQEVLFAFVIGLFLGVVYDWTDSIGLVTVIHGALNVFLFAVLPIQGSSLLA